MENSQDEPTKMNVLCLALELTRSLQGMVDRGVIDPDEHPAGAAELQQCAELARSVLDGLQDALALFDRLGEELAGED